MSSCLLSWQLQQQPLLTQPSQSLPPTLPTGDQRVEQGTSCMGRALSDEGVGGDERVPQHCPAATVPEPGRTRMARCNDYPTK